MALGALIAIIGIWLVINTLNQNLLKVLGIGQDKSLKLGVV